MHALSNRNTLQICLRSDGIEDVDVTQKVCVQCNRRLFAIGVAGVGITPDRLDMSAHFRIVSHPDTPLELDADCI